MSDADEAASIRREQEWHLTRLGDIPAEREALDTRERELVHGARTAGVSWERIGVALGTGADEARKRFGEPEPGKSPF